MHDSDDAPLEALDDWDDFIGQRVYPTDGARARDDYRDFESTTRGSVRELYRLNHRCQTLDFVLAKEAEYGRLDRRRMSALEALEFLDTLVDDSDPDLDLSQLQHLLQTSEAIRRDGHPDWFVLTGLLHDLGKVLCLFGEPQWAVVGDTFPVGCAFSDRIVYPELFEDHPDRRDPRPSSVCGIYEQNCGLRNVHLSWGHDEYLYRVLKGHLPEAALYMIRFHSFYAWHREREYDWLCDEHDREMLEWVQRFNSYDLYSKSPQPPDWDALRLTYEGLIAEYLPAVLCF